LNTESMKVSFGDCCRDLLRPGAAEAQNRLEKWTRSPKFAQVVPFVESFTHEYLFALAPDAVRKVVASSSHALGDVESREQMEEIEDFTTPFALQHLFHWYIEKYRILPTWKQFRDWMVEGEAAPLWYEILRRHLGAPSSADERRQWSRAARWRLGKFYLSAMREIDLLARLRATGLPVRYHLLADVLFRTDFWLDGLLVCLYFPNPRYRDGAASGRKPPAESFFSGAKPPFDIVHFPVERQGFGKVWMATDASVEALAGLMRRHMGLANE
jgi:hypothetical protein